MNLTAKTIVITGAAQGLGLAIAARLAANGAHLALLDMNAEALATAAESLAENSGRVETFTCNIADEAQVVATFDAIMQSFGQIDAVVNNAGITRDGLLVKTKDGAVVETLSLAQWQQVIDVNLTGVFLCGREAAKHMINSQTAGVIINISSISRHGNVGQSNYAAAKAGVAALTSTWAKELSRYKIRSAAIAPGFIATEMTQAIKPEILERIKNSIPLKTMGSPDNIAATVQFILENDYISGRVIEVDGALRL
ncbi:MAG: SDR family oxidoreductase [Gammaproteobacteria bacterium]|nr:SDR family oxidoreductase [Gammaproteobacteria bacterium]